MSSPAEPRPAVLRFLDAFLQERNIKWMLGIGILILLGSSLMLVTAHWESYTPVWKYLILLGYTAGVHGLGQLSYHSLALRKTGTGLMVLTVLLIPLTFLGLHWVQPVVSLSGQLGLISLLAVTAGFSLLAARRIFDHFLRGSQPTFLASYAVLASAGAIAPSLPASTSPVATLLLWLVFAVGATKVNRHVFWLAEEHRLPRIYGFVPILLLGGMFLMLFAAGLAPHVSLPWIGFGLVLTAVPVLLTADALAHVFQQRNVAMPRPLPWSIVLPIILGIIMTITGVCLSGVGFPNTASLPLTAALAAVVMAVVARRTGRQEFAWLTLIAVTAAYQTSPVFFQEFARAVVREGAAAVHEQKLPFAFYGLTYLPLLTGLSGIAFALNRRDEGVFSIPLRRFSIALGVMLLLASLTHAKALFSVGLALMALFGLQLMLFRDRRLLLPAVAAFVLGGIGFETFSEQLLRLPSTIELPLLAWAITGGLLLWPGRMIDRVTSAQWTADAGRWNLISVCRWTSLAALIVTAGVWLVRASWFGEVAVISGLLCGALLMVHAWQLADRRIGRLAISNLALVAAVLAAHVEWPFAAVMVLESLLLFGLWLTGRGFRISASGQTGEETSGTKLNSLRALRLAGSDVAAIGLGGIALLYVLPTMVVTLLTGVSFSAWMVATVSLIWTIDAARRGHSAPLTVVAWLLSLGALGVLSATAFGWQTVSAWYPALGTLLPILIIGRIRPCQPNAESQTHVSTTLRICAFTTLAVVAMGSLVLFTVPMRVAGIAAFAGLLWSAARWPDVRLRTAAFSVAGWQGLAAVLQASSPYLRAINELSFPLSAAIALPLALASAALSILWNSEWMKQRTLVALNEAQRMTFRGMAVIGLLSMLSIRGSGLSIWETALAIATFFVFAAEQLWTGQRLFAEQPGDERSLTRRRDEAERHVWMAEAIVVCGIVYLLLVGVLTLGSTVSLFAPLIAGILLWSVASLSSDSERWSFLTRPFVRTALALPLLTVIAGTFRHMALPAPGWLGLNSLALLITAAFYFWRGLEKRTPSLLVGSAGIFNVAFILLRREFSFSDPQFFMIPLGLSLLGLVELLKPQIPTRFIDPLRYIGALTILVSPTFHIVGGSWLHLLTLMVASVLITLLAIGLRVRALMYAGTAFLAADLVAMVVRGSLVNTNLLWIAGIGIGAAVIGLAAYCERHREDMLQRLRMLAAELQTWD